MTPFASNTIACGVIVICLKIVYEMVLLLQKQFTGKGNPSVYCNYPVGGTSHCAFASTDFTKVREQEIVDGVARELGPALEQVNKTLGEIRDGVRDMGKGRNR